MNIILRKDNFIAAKCKTVRSHRFMPVDIRQFLTLSSSVIIIIATVLVFKGGSRAMLLGGGVPELLGGCELDGAKRRRASATEAARSACRGSCGRGLGAFIADFLIRY